MMNPIPISLSWSGGKDSAFALYLLKNNPSYQVVRLHTTFSETTSRVGMHGIREELIQAQADELGIPLDKLYYPASGDNQAYENAINLYLERLSLEGIHQLGYGDIFLEDLRKYRESQLAQKGFQAVFPLWKRSTPQLAREFIEEGFKTLICAIDPELVPKSFLGEVFDFQFLKAIDGIADPCGENGEFHTFCFEGPIFKKPLPVHVVGHVEQLYKIPLENGEVAQKAFSFAEISLA